MLIPWKAFTSHIWYRLISHIDPWARWSIWYPPLIKHGLLENGPWMPWLWRWFSQHKTSNPFENFPAMFDDTRGYSSSSLDIIKHHEPLLMIINHHKPLSTTIFDRVSHTDPVQPIQPEGIPKPSNHGTVRTQGATRWRCTTATTSAFCAWAIAPSKLGVFARLFRSGSCFKIMEIEFRQFCFDAKSLRHD